VHRKLISLLFAMNLLAACSFGGRAGTEGTSTPTVAPTLTPTAAAPLVILVLPADTAADESDRYQTMIYNLAQAQGMRFQVRNTLTPADLAFEGPALKVVIALPPDPGLAALTAAAPGVQFLAVSIPDLAPAANLSTIGGSGLPVDQQAFLAGYIAGLLAPEWRVGLLTQNDTPDGEVAKVAFTNGFHFFCGKCWDTSFNAPVRVYPIIVGIPADAATGEYVGYADFIARGDFDVRVAFVSPEVAALDVLNRLVQKGFLLIGQNLPDEGLRANWIVSIQPDIDSAIQSIFPELVAGRGGQTVPTPLLLVDINPDLLTEGKLRLVQEVLAGLQNGSIGTTVGP
jgi:hypothetical protein